MIALIQRVKEASVTVSGKKVSAIQKGYLVLLGIFESDTQQDVEKVARKLTTLRIMSDSAGKMNCSILDEHGEILVVSQFTLCADITYGRRPSFIKAMQQSKAQEHYEHFISELKKASIPVQTGAFGSYMDVALINDGPVTIILDSTRF